MVLSNVHRIQWFDQQSRADRYPNSGDLAEKFEISRRQAQRDIEYMEASLRAPLRYVAKHRGYDYEHEAYTLPLLYVTEEEKQVLQYLAYRYRQYDYEHSEQVRRIAHLLDRFTDEKRGAAESRLPVFDVNPRLMQTIQLLSHAVRDCKIVRITYLQQGEESRLSVWPLRIYAQFQADYMLAYCEQESADQIYRLDDIRQVVVTEQTFDRTGLDSGAIKRDPPLKLKPYLARIGLNRPLAGSAWHGYPAQRVTELQYDVQFYDIDSFLQHLLGSEWSRLESPKWLKSRLISRCEHLLTQLKDGGQ